ncbi:MAG: delta-lactam-biosynthetic de-N-acetylase [Clostridia bacterium]|nr:delta-lactam-biosynthetic de-N-acetylase [Clostridia bacterium]
MRKIFLLFLLPLVLTGCGEKQTFRREITEDVANVAKSVPASLNEGYEHLSNNTYGWGLKKNKNAPPEVPEEIVKLIEENGGIYKDSEPQTLYLTFDEGYENGYTAQILDVLKRQNVPAAFFVTGPYLKKETELIQRMVAEGHTVGNHTVNHPSMPSVKSAEKLKSEITELADSFHELTGETMRFFRPPMGEYSERTLAITKELGYTTVFWSFAYRDWETNAQKGTEYAYKQITEGVHDGAILLLHAVSKDNAEVLEQVIVDLKAAGYRFKSLEDFGNRVID